MSLFTLVLFLHVALAIVAFGASFGFPFIFSLAAKEPAHLNFALRATEAVVSRLMTPAFVVMPFLGLWLIYISPFQWDLWRSEWLVTSIGIYTAAFFYGALVQGPVSKRLIALTGGQPKPEDLPEIQRLAKRAQIGGMLLGIAVIVIALLMVWKPGGQPVT